MKKIKVQSHADLKKEMMAVASAEIKAPKDAHLLSVNSEDLVANIDKMISVRSVMTHGSLVTMLIVIALVVLGFLSNTVLLDFGVAILMFVAAIGFLIMSKTKS